jgi:hypothetical protein
MTLRKVVDYKGKKPAPRTSHEMLHLVAENGDHLLVIYGGRNDNIYKQTANVALNDVCLFNINTKTWEALAIFGQMPCSRWSHFMTHVQGDTRCAKEGLIMFGGSTQKSYCRTILWNLVLPE